MPLVWEGYRLGGRYEIQELLGEGGMSAVYKAFDHNLKRTVAVKIIHPHLVDDEDFIQRFETEARAVAQLNHPNIVQVYDFAAEGELYYMVLEYVPGETLRAVLDRLEEKGERIPPAEAVDLLSQVSDAVDYAHKRGMVHRDLKPANIILRPTGEPVLTDFGLARLMGSTRRTRTGMVLGTVFYMAPEQVLGEHVDHRADIYALGVILFEMLTGRLPFEGESLTEVMQHHLHSPVPDPREIVPSLPPAFTEVVRRAMAKKPEDRFQSAAEFKEALEKALGDGDKPPAEGASLRRTVVEAAAGSLAGTVVEPAVQAEPAEAGALSAARQTPPAKGKIASAVKEASKERKKPTLLHMASLESAMLAGVFGGAAYVVSAPVLLWAAVAWWAIAVLILLRYLPEWWALSRAYQLVLMNDRGRSSQHKSTPAGLPFRFQIPRLEFPNDMELMAFPAALAAVLTTGVGLAAVFGAPATWLALTWLVVATPVWFFHLRFLALNFLQPGVLERIHFGHFLIALSLGVVAVPGIALAYNLPKWLQGGVLILSLGAFGVGGMLGSLTLIFLLRRALSTGLPRPIFAPLVFFISPLVAVYAVFTLLLLDYLSRSGLFMPPVVFVLTVFTAWGIDLAGVVLAVMVYQGYRRVKVPFSALSWGTVDVFVGFGLLGVASWGIGLRGQLVSAITVVSALAGALLFFVIAWEYHRRFARG